MISYVAVFSCVGIDAMAKKSICRAVRNGIWCGEIAAACLAMPDQRVIGAFPVLICRLLTFPS